MMTVDGLVLCVLVICKLFISSECTPGVPVIEWADRNYALVQVSQTAVAYEKLVTRSESVNVEISWNVWNGGGGDEAYVYFDQNIVWSGDAKPKRATIRIDRGGSFSARVKLGDADGCSVSAESVQILVADTDGIHMTPFKFVPVWNENNVPYASTTDRVVAAYFVEWSVYGRDYPLDAAPLPNLSHLLYGFVPICGPNESLKNQIPSSHVALQKSCAGRKDFQVAIHDPWAAVQKPLKGVSDWNEPIKGNFGQMMAAKRSLKSLKILPSIGGWTLSDPFYYMNDPSNRATFVDSVREFLNTWKFFDGVDIDWEFPGGKGANPSLGDEYVDGETYSALMRDLRIMLDELSSVSNRTYLLTTAISGGEDKIRVVDYGSETQHHLDRIFVMTYDFKGAWSDTDLGYHTTLYAPSWNHLEPYTTDRAIRHLVNVQKVRSDKIVVGVAMYGRGWTGVSGYRDDNPFTGRAVGPIEGTWERGVLDYRSIVKTFDFLYDTNAEAAYAFRRKDGALVTFDDARSVRAKGKYVVDENLGGLFAWEIDADNGDILNAMHDGLGHEKLFPHHSEL
uniref:Chitinase n=1 Tax=Spodoptera litura multicapsid nucleopolyhedrovirus TaxID=46242 RepID=B0LUL7_NPVST|nr:chitinase [Spodoptera litura nucleopolyhedrovirus]